MTIGEKIKRVRKFRKMTQAELGTAVGLGENAQNRIAHYERGTRVPQKELLDRMAEVLDVNRYMLYDLTGQNNSEFIQMMFWIEEVNPGIFKLFQLQKFPGEKCNESDDPGVYYHGRVLSRHRQLARAPARGYVVLRRHPQQLYEGMAAPHGRKKGWPDLQGRILRMEDQLAGYL